MAINERFLDLWKLKVDRSTQLRPAHYGFAPGALLVLRRRVWAFIEAKNKEMGASEQRRFTIDFGPDKNLTIKTLKHMQKDHKEGVSVGYTPPEYITVKRII